MADPNTENAPCVTCGASIPPLPVACPADPRVFCAPTAEKALLDGSRDLTVGAVGERGEPLDPEVRDLAALAYLVVTCEALGIEADDEWDGFMYARAVHRRVHAVLTSSPVMVDRRGVACTCGRWPHGPGCNARGRVSSPGVGT